MKVRAFLIWVTVGCVTTTLAVSGQATATSITNAPPLPPPPPPPPVRSGSSQRPLPPQPAAPAFPQRIRANPTNRPPGFSWPVPLTNTGFRPATNRTPAPVLTPLAPFPLVFDAESKTIDPQPGQTNVTFTFKFTNTTPTEVTIDRVQTSCGCTVAKLPAMPWKLAAGTNGEFQVVADLRGKRGLYSKMVYVYTSQGFKALNVKVNLPDPASSPAAERMRNLQIAVADRQAVFKGDCARCHSDPGVGKKGRELYQAVCGVCHEAERRATMVPNLRALKHPTDAEHWRNWVTHGKAGTLMPAFSQTDGGPFTQEQIDSLVAYLVENIPSRPVSAPGVPSALPTQ